MNIIRKMNIDPPEVLETPTILAYRTKDWKYVTYPEEGFKSELYNLNNDLRLYNLIDETHARVLSKLDKSFKKLLNKINYTPPTELEVRQVSKKYTINKKWFILYSVMIV